MPTSDSSWSGRLRVVGDLERPDHWHLTPEDSCAFFGEYTARMGYAHSKTNQLIHNLKKKPELAQTPQYVWKRRAIQEIGEALRNNLRADALARTLVVPIPPSKPPGTPGYDDRMAQVARAIGPGATVRELLVTTAERQAMHATSSHRDPDALRASLQLRAALTPTAPVQVLLLDDVLTTGCSFRVCKQMIQEQWPETAVFGVFAARRVIDHASEFDDLTL